MLHNNNSHSWAWVTCERVVEVIMNYLLYLLFVYLFKLTFWLALILQIIPLVTIFGRGEQYTIVYFWYTEIIKVTKDSGMVA